MLRGHKDTYEQFGESDTVRAEAERLTSMPLTAVAVEVIARAYTGEPGMDPMQPPWIDPLGQGPTAYDITNWLFLPQSEELDASAPFGRMLYGVVSEAVQLLEHASLLRCHLSEHHLRFVLTRHGISVRDAGAVDHVLNGGSL